MSTINENTEVFEGVTIKELLDIFQPILDIMEFEHNNPGVDENLIESKLDECLKNIFQKLKIIFPPNPHLIVLSLAISLVNNREYILPYLKTMVNNYEETFFSSIPDFKTSGIYDHEHYIKQLLNYLKLDKQKKILTSKITLSDFLLYILNKPNQKNLIKLFSTFFIIIIANTSIDIRNNGSKSYIRDYLLDDQNNNKFDEYLLVEIFEGLNIYENFSLLVSPLIIFNELSKNSNFTEKLGIYARNEYFEENFHKNKISLLDVRGVANPNKIARKYKKKQNKEDILKLLKKTMSENRCFPINESELHSLSFLNTNLNGGNYDEESNLYEHFSGGDGKLKGIETCSYDIENRDSEKFYKIYNLVKNNIEKKHGKKIDQAYDEEMTLLFNKMADNECKLMESLKALSLIIRRSKYDNSTIIEGQTAQDIIEKEEPLIKELRETHKNKNVNEQLNTVSELKKKNEELEKKFTDDLENILTLIKGKKSTQKTTRPTNN